MHQHSRHCCTIAGLQSLPLVPHLVIDINSKAFGMVQEPSGVSLVSSNWKGASTLYK